MNNSRRRILIASASVFIASLAVATVFATTSFTDKSPLFNYRMQQASSRMNFVPAQPNPFTYTTEQGYSLDYGICIESSGALSLYTRVYDTCYRCTSRTCEETCGLQPTCILTLCVEC